MARKNKGGFLYFVSNLLLFGALQNDNRPLRVKLACDAGCFIGFIGCLLFDFKVGIYMSLIAAIIAYLMLGDVEEDKVKSSRIAYEASQRRTAASKLTFVPDENLAAFLRNLPISERLRYLGSDNVPDLAHRYYTCMTKDEMDEYLSNPAEFSKIKPQKVKPKYRYLEEWFKNRQNDSNTVENAGGAVIASSRSENYEENNGSNINWSNDYKPVQYDKDDTYDNFHMQREEEYQQEYGDDAEDAIQDAWEEHKKNNRR